VWIATDVPDTVFRVVLPLYGLFVIAAIIAHRSRLLKQMGRDPIVLHPFHKTDTPHQYLESVLLVGAVALALDVVLNALWPHVMTQRLAIPAIRTSAWCGWLGLAIVTSGLFLSAAGVSSMGRSWRIGIDREKPGPLVTGGLFGRMRHPIYAGMLLVTLGMAGVTGDLLSTAVAAGAWVGIPVQARLEEDFLLSRHGDEYRTYQARTGRFWPIGHRKASRGR
jgi:protein-S-isoprenylcysteine O-methyltransferase Ste14